MQPKENVMSVYDHNQTSASTADNDNYITFVTDDSDGVFAEVEYEFETEWISSSTEYYIKEKMVGIISENSFWKRMIRMERLEKGKQKMILFDKKNYKSHMTRCRQYHLKN